MQIAALVLAGALSVMGSTAAGVPNEQPAQIPDEPVTAEQQSPVQPTPTEPVSAAEPTPTPAPAPEVTKIPASQLNYSVTLGEFTTKFSTSNTNRCTNLKLATEAINGYIVEGGAEFSFNDVVGKRSSAKGYKSAPVISGGTMTTGLGGGVCQISTTVFNAALLSNMTITERWPHSLKSSYVQAGRDASVSWGSADFKFANPYTQPVKVSAKYNKKGSVTVSILGPDGSSAPWVKLNVTNSAGKYILTRTYGNTVNYTAYSKYK